MVPYAGFDPEEGKPGYYPAMRSKPRERAYVMFKAGRDTFDISQVLNVPEHRVLAWINVERSRHRRLPDPYRDSEA